MEKATVLPPEMAGTLPTMTTNMSDHCADTAREALSSRQLAAKAAAAKALFAASSLQDFIRLLARAGYGFRVRGLNPTLTPAGSRSSIRLQYLGLRASFWIQHHIWDEDFEQYCGMRHPLMHFWKAITNKRLGIREMMSVDRFAGWLGPQAVMGAMCAACRNLEHSPTHEQFLYFCKVCWNLTGDRRSPSY